MENTHMWIVATIVAVLILLVVSIKIHDRNKKQATVEEKEVARLNHLRGCIDKVIALIKIADHRASRSVFDGDDYEVTYPMPEYWLVMYDGCLYQLSNRDRSHPIETRMWLDNHIPSLSKIVIDESDRSGYGLSEKRWTLSIEDVDVSKLSRVPDDVRALQALMELLDHLNEKINSYLPAANSLSVAVKDLQFVRVRDDHIFRFRPLIRLYTDDKWVDDGFRGQCVYAQGIEAKSIMLHDTKTYTFADVIGDEFLRSFKNSFPFVQDMRSETGYIKGYEYYPEVLPYLERVALLLKEYNIDLSKL